MSSFIVSDDCIQSIMSMAAGWTVPDTRYLCTGSTDVDNIQALGARLVDLNHQAVAIRYPNHPRDPVPVATEVDWRMKHVPLLRGIKALQCWLYQCAEGEAVEGTILYHQMKELCDRACQEFVSQQDGYKEAPWG